MPAVKAKARVFPPDVLTGRECAAHFEFQLYYYPPDSAAGGFLQIDGIEHEPTEFIFGKSTAEVAEKLAEWFKDEC